MQTDLPVNDASYLLGILEACNNNVAYAYACVKLGLQKFIVSESAPLHEAAKSFAMLVHRKGSLATLMALMQNDAPRFLGKTSAACAAVVFLDSDWDQLKIVFMPVLESHVLCLMADAVGQDGSLESWVAPVVVAERMEASFKLRRCGPQDMTNARMWDLVLSATKRNVFTINALTPGPPIESEGENVRQQEKQRKHVFALDDFHVFQAMVGGVDVGPAVMATSPRAARRRRTLSFISKDQTMDEEVFDDIDNADEHCSACSEGKAEHTRANDGQAIYCYDCQKWLNGPTQYDDHKFGKKHKKNLRKKSQIQPQRGSSSNDNDVAKISIGVAHHATAGACDTP